jgi:hypothetical protein
MSDAATGQPVSFGENKNPGPKKAAEVSESIYGDLERFSRLSSDLGKCLSDVALKIKNSVDEFNTVEQEVLHKKAELKEIYDVEASAAVLANLVEEHRLQKAEFEKFMENQRRLWEEEKLKREHEDEEYRQALQLHRQQEEKEYEKKWSEKRDMIRQKLEEELRAIQHQNSEQRKLLEIDLLNRERILKKKELEWDKLVQELDLFMTRLLARTRKDNINPIPVRPDIGNMPAVKNNLTSDTPRRAENVSVEKEMSDAGRELDESGNSSVESIRKMLLSQERRIDNIYESLKENLKSAPFKATPPKEP